ncbi:MAG: hypothetical protein ACK5UE_09105 [Chitinophagales bacterium]|jgi:hypothetical protein|nr:hypothetical protein [Sphingobacteriales bacterium]
MLFKVGGANVGTIYDTLIGNIQISSDNILNGTASSKNGSFLELIEY